MMEKHTIKAPSKRKYHHDGTFSKAEVMLIHQTLILNVSSIELTPNNIVDAPPTSKLTKRGNYIGFV